MKFVIENPDGSFTDLTMGAPIVVGDVVHPWQIVDLWSADELAAIGISKVPVPVTVDDVVAERERRLSLGFDYDFGDARGVHRFGTTKQDMLGWDEVSKLASARLQIGDETPILIVTETGSTSVTPTEWQHILVAAAEARQPLWVASFVLQAMDPIPANYTADEHWA